MHLSVKDGGEGNVDRIYAGLLRKLNLDSRNSGRYDEALLQPPSAPRRSTDTGEFLIPVQRRLRKFFLDHRSVHAERSLMKPW